MTGLTKEFIKLYTTIKYTTLNYKEKLGKIDTVWVCVIV